MGTNKRRKKRQIADSDPLGTFCISNIKMNNDTVGIWHFKTYKGPYPGRGCLAKKLPDTVVVSHRFRGVDSYLRAGRSDTGLFTQDGRQQEYVGFQMNTQQPDSLLFLLGSNPDQFFALEVVDGKLTMSWNFGFPGGHQNATVEDDSSSVVKSSTLLIKTGVVKSMNMAVMSINNIENQTSV